MKCNCIYLNSETLQLTAGKCDTTDQDYFDVKNGRVVFRSYPDTVELKEFNFLCINECGDKWQTKSYGSDSKDAFSNFKLIYPHDTVIAII